MCAYTWQDQRRILYSVIQWGVLLSSSSSSWWNRKSHYEWRTKASQATQPHWLLSHTHEIRIEILYLVRDHSSRSHRQERTKINIQSTTHEVGCYFLYLGFPTKSNHVEVCKLQNTFKKITKRTRRLGSWETNPICLSMASRAFLSRKCGRMHENARPIWWT